MQFKENVSAESRAERIQACDMWKVASEPGTKKGNGVKSFPEVSPRHLR